MDPVRDPFTPGAGVRPPFVAGRAQEILDFDVALQRAQLARAVRGTVLTGVRGMGKTVLLKEMEKAARSHDWAVVSLEADRRSGFPGQLGQEASKTVRALVGKPVIAERLRGLADRVRGIHLGTDAAGNATVGVDFAEPSAQQSVGARDLADVLVTTAKAMQEQQGTGLLVCVDELQQLDDVTLHALTLASHRASQELTPFVLLGAGLPELPGRLASVTSYDERLFAYAELEALQGAAFDEAIQGALALEDADIDLEGLALLATLSGGYPFFAQVYGSATWQAATSPRITAADVDRGASAAMGKLNGFFAARWGRASTEEQRYMRAIATRKDDGIAHTVASRIAGLPLDIADQARGRLRFMGLVQNPEPDTVGFTVPLFWRFIARQPT